MQRSDDDTTTPIVELSGADARSAGWALSGVTAIVLVVGLLVIRSTRSEIDAREPVGAQRTAAVEVPNEEPRQRTIVLEPTELPEQTSRQPRPLPSTGTVERRPDSPARSASVRPRETTNLDRL